MDEMRRDAPRAGDPAEWSDDAAARRREWFRYYSEKRIGHQWLQAHLLKDLAVERVLEVGPGLGLVSAMLHNAGFQVTTLDVVPSQYPHPEIAHIEADLRGLEAERIAGFDAILCCETLEHLPWEAVDGVLACFRRAEPRQLVISVPYMAAQLDLRLYLNRVAARQWFSLRWPRAHRRYPADPHGDPWGHKWEVGYRGTGLKALEAKLTATGWRVRRRAFSSPCRSVFYRAEPA